MAVLTVVPFAVIPVAAGTAVTLLLVNVFPARRARDILMLMGLLFAASLVLLLRFIRPEQLLKVESLPDLTAFFATLQSPITPLLPSFWAGETLFASLRGGSDLLHAGALWTTALASIVILGAANERWDDRVTNIPFSLHCCKRLDYDKWCPTMSSSCSKVVPAPDTLYHFTDCAGLSGILTTKGSRKNNSYK